MWKRLLVTVLLGSALALAGAPAAHAIDCAQAIKNAEHNLNQVEAEAQHVRPQSKPRIKSFLSEARRLLTEARAMCAKAHTTTEKAEARAKVTLAEGDIAAANLFVKFD